MEQVNNDHFGGVFYINLERRPDRRKEIERELGRLGLQFERFNGVDKKPGIVGCGLSHLAVLKEARERGLPNVLIFEDDFEFLVPKELFWSQINKFFELRMPYDVLMLSYNIEAEDNDLMALHNVKPSEPVNDLIFKVNSNSTASGYIVHSYFYDALIELYEENLPLLESTGKHWIYANDQIWKKLQPTAKWYGFNTRIGRQRASYSDNSLKFIFSGK